MKAGIIARLLEVLERDIVPLTREGVRNGNKIFGAAVLRKSDLGLVVAGTNLETDCPLWHGEVATIKALYELPQAARPPARECLFLSTHEPCSMCLSAITWAGFDTFYYLFGYEDTREAFQIPHDLRILSEVFRCENGGYARENAYWKAHGIVEEIEARAEPERAVLLVRVEELRRVYGELSAHYQRLKSGGEIPLS
jgi:tRNA(Arg) A34 adenosine deaminase TadA